MNSKHISIFNLIEIFRQSSKSPQPITADEHCEQKHHHDFYCDSEKPYISI